MHEEQLNDGIFGRVRVVIETEFAKVRVVSNHIADRICQFGDDASKGRFIEGLLQILDDSEIDIAFFEEGDRPTCVASIGVEIQGHVFVGHLSKLVQPHERGSPWDRLDTTSGRCRGCSTLVFWVASGSAQRAAAEVAADGAGPPGPSARQTGP